MVDRKKRNQGMNWISQKKRLAIYLRDGMACAYCGNTIEDGAKLTLDHLKPHSKGGLNTASNLVTCCPRCNSSRGNRTVRSFCFSVAEYLGSDTDGHQIMSFVRNCAKRSLKKYLIESTELLVRRGSCLNVINSNGRKRWKG